MFNKKIVIATIFFTLLVTLAVVFRPVPVPSADNTVKTFGTIEEVYEAGHDGVVLRLRDDDRLFYMHQALQNGFEANALQGKLTGSPAEIYYVKYWSPLERLNKYKYTTKVDIRRPVFYPSK
ncbi:MAG: hypothetical protein WKF87_05940 [Chryseolinea sp.]